MKIDVEQILSTMGVQMLPAKEGDCILVQLPITSGTFRMMIDCGPPSSWDNFLHNLFETMHSQDIFIDILVITHIYSDHIGGAIGLFQDELLSRVVREVWYNGLEQLLLENDDNRSPTLNDIYVYRKLSSETYNAIGSVREEISTKQGKALSILLNERKTPVNKHFGGQAITSSSNIVHIENNLSIHILTPHYSALSSLVLKFQTELNSLRMGTKLSSHHECVHCFDVACQSVPINNDYRLN